MDNETYIDTVIMKMDMKSLFNLVLEQPEYISDSYYREFGTAIQARYDELTK